ncbi:MAG: peptide deformylase [Abditibacteriota bacterium]|nr:peptide deformylase [Abditibacteriota bacterium]
MIRPILLVPDPRLKQRCEEQKYFDTRLGAILDDLEATRLASPGCVGIASPQIGEMTRVAIVDTSNHKKHGAQSQGRLVLINPVIVEQHGESIGREGCLSLPDFTASVRRAAQIEIAYSDEQGASRTLVSTDFEAIVIQHEIDHLDGVLFLDRVANLQTDVFPRKVRK